MFSFKLKNYLKVNLGSLIIRFCKFTKVNKFNLKNTYPRTVQIHRCDGGMGLKDRLVAPEGDFIIANLMKLIVATHR